MNSVGLDRVQIGENKFISKSTFLSHLKTYNLYYEGQALQLIHREDEGQLIIEGLLNVFWGLRRPIRLQMQDEEPDKPRPSVTSLSAETDVTRLGGEERNKARALKHSSGEEAGSDVVRRKICGRRLGIRRGQRHRCSFNGHFYNHRTAVFTPAFGSVTNVRVSSCMTAAQVLQVLLHKFRIENNPREFTLCLIHTSGERHQLKPSDRPLGVRVLQGPCEQVCKIFLMEMDQVEEVTYDVAQYIKFELPVLQGFITKLQEEEEREIKKLKRRYADMHNVIKRHMQSLSGRTT